MKKLFLILIMCLLSTLAFANGQVLPEIETAVLEEDYEAVKVMSESALAGELEKFEVFDVKYYLGLSQLRLKEYPQAYQTFKGLLSSLPPADVYDKAAVGLADSLYLQGLYSEANKQILDLLVKRPDSDFLSLFYLKVARTYLKMAEWEKAHKYLQKILNDFPKSFESQTAKVLMEEKQFFTVQVGAFKDKERAAQVMREVSEKNEYAYIVEVSIAQGEKFYRVRVGELGALDDAQALEKKLSSWGYPTLIYP